MRSRRALVLPVQPWNNQAKKELDANYPRGADGSDMTDAHCTVCNRALHTRSCLTQSRDSVSVFSDSAHPERPLARPCGHWIPISSPESAARPSDAAWILWPRPRGWVVIGGGYKDKERGFSITLSQSSFYNRYDVVCTLVF